MTTFPALRAALLYGVVPTEPVVVGPEWPAVLEETLRERIIGLLSEAVGDRRVVLPLEALPELEERRREAMKFDAIVDSVARTVAEPIAREKIEWRALKGVATARLLYSHVGSRHMGDLDVLVRESQFQHAVDDARRTPRPARDRHLARYYQSHPRAVWLSDALSAPGRLSALTRILWPTRSFLHHMNRTPRQHLLHLGARLGGFLRPGVSRSDADDDA